MPAKLSTFEEFDRELQLWLSRRKQIDELLEKPTLTLITALDRARAADEDGVVPSAICEAADAHTHERSLLVDAMCNAVVKRVQLQSRRFAWLDSARSEQLNRVASAKRMLEPMKNASSSNEPLRLLERMRDDVFGAPNLLLAAELFGLLIRSGEQHAHAKLGFFSLFCILWRLGRKGVDGTIVGANIDPWRPSAVVTAKCLAPLRSVVQAMRYRAKLYRAIVDEITEVRTNFGWLDQHTRWKLASALERLASTLHEFAVVATNPEDFRDAADHIIAIVRSMTATSDWDQRRRVWKSIRDLMSNVLVRSGEQNQTLLGGTSQMLDAIERDIVKAHETAEGQAALRKFASAGVPQEKPHSYWQAEQGAATAALRVCRAALTSLIGAADISVRLTPPGTQRGIVMTPKLIRTLKELARLNESLADLIEDHVRPNVRWLRGVLTQEIAFASAGNDTDFDAAELLSAVSVVERWMRISQMEVEDAVRHSLSARRKDGSWISGQPILMKHRVLGVWPNTAEIASLVATTIEGSPHLRVADDALFEFVGWLDKMKIEFARPRPCTLAQVATKPPARDKTEYRIRTEKPPTSVVWSGWPSETREHDVIDFWSTALSVNALLTIRDIVERRLWEICEQRFHVVHDLTPLWAIDPVDLGARHEKRLHHRIALMARETRSDRWANAEYSLILHGPPGSSKTAIAQAMASEMWKHSHRKQRLVRITPADFTRQGESRIDSEARFIFDLLSHIRSATLFFDEIDDLFRKRRKDGELNFLSLIVPAMLNRLQDLRDAAPRQEICFLLATNYIDNIEPALTRPGRIDSLIPLPYPDRSSRENILERKLVRNPISHGLKELVLTRTDGWPWATFNNLCKKIVGLRTRQQVQQMIAYHETQFEAPTEYYYGNKKRWDGDLSRPLMNEAVHAVFASCETIEDGLEKLKRIETHLPPDRRTVKLRSKLRELFREEWTRDGRYVETDDQKLKLEQEAGLGWLNVGKGVPEATASDPMPGVRQAADSTDARVWAPSAYAVALAGTFNQWSTTKTLLGADAHGFWSKTLGHSLITSMQTHGRALPTPPDDQPEGQYKFVIFNLDRPRPIWRNDPYATELFRFPLQHMKDGQRKVTMVTNSVVSAPYRWTSESKLALRTEDLVLYQLHPGTFNPHGAESVLDGVTRKLEDLRDLGVSAIEILVTGDRQVDDWGYDNAFPFAIFNSAGGSHAFCRMVDEAHRRGIGVFFGLAYDKIGAVERGLWHYDGWQPRNDAGGIYYTWPSTPNESLRPEYDQPEVRQFLLDNAVRWATERHIDGFRWHRPQRLAAERPTTSRDQYTAWHVMRDVNKALRNLDKLIIAEDVDDSADERDPLLFDAEKGLGCDAMWDQRFMQRLHAVLHADDQNRDLALLKAAIEPRPFRRRVIYTDSYAEAAKEARPPRRHDGLFAPYALLGMAIVLTAPGIPMLFQGQEFLDQNLFTPANPLDWKVAAANESARAIVRRLIACRRNLDGKTAGLRGDHVRTKYDAGTQSIAYWRWDGEAESPADCTIVAANFSRGSVKTAIGVPEGGRWVTRCASWTEEADEYVAGDEITLTLPPHGFAILSREAM